MSLVTVITCLAVGQLGSQEVANEDPNDLDPAPMGDPAKLAGAPKEEEPEAVEAKEEEPEAGEAKEEEPEAGDAKEEEPEAGDAKGDSKKNDKEEEKSEKKSTVESVLGDYASAVNLQQNFAPIGARAVKPIPSDAKITPNYIEHFCDYNNLVFFQNDGYLHVDAPENIGRNLIVIDAGFGKDVIKALRNDSVLHVPAGEPEKDPDRLTAHIVSGYNQLHFLDVARSHLLVEGQIEFRHFIVEKFGLDADVIVGQPSIPAKEKIASQRPGADGDRVITSEILFEDDGFEMRAFRFEHAWVEETMLEFGKLDGNEKDEVVAPGVFDAFVRLCSAATGKPYKVVTDGEIEPTGADTDQIQRKGADQDEVDGDVGNREDIREITYKNNRKSNISKELAREPLTDLQAAWAANALDTRIQLAKDASQDRLRAIEEDYLSSGFSGYGNGGGGSAQLLLEVLDNPVALQLLLERQRARSQVTLPPLVERVVPVGAPVVSPFEAFKSDISMAFLAPSARAKDSGARKLTGGRMEQNPGMIADPATNSIIIIEEKRLMGTFEKIRRQLDVAPHLVEINVAIVDINTNHTFDWEVDAGFTGLDRVTRGSRLSNRTIFDGGLFNSDGSPADRSVVSNPFTGGFLDSGITPQAVVRGSSFGISGQLIMPNWSLQARIRALEGTEDMKIIARPSLLTIDGRTAALTSTDSIFIDTLGKLDAELFKVNAPFAFSVTPRMVGNGESGEVVLAIEIEESQVASKVEDETPFVGRSRIQTSAILGEAESLVIGGRYLTDERERESRAPIVGKIPVVGAAFKDRQYRRSKKQRLFVITPRIIDPMSLHPSNSSRD